MGQGRAAELRRVDEDDDPLGAFIMADIIAASASADVESPCKEASPTPTRTVSARIGPALGNPTVPTVICDPSSTNPPST